MKKFLCVSVLLIVLVTIVACGGNDSDLIRVNIGATPVPHQEILRYIQPALREAGIDLQITPFTVFHQVNPALADGAIDANYFQHRPFFNNSPESDQLYWLGNVHIEPMGAYSYWLNDISELPDGARVAIPGDATNKGRAFLLLHNHGVITIDLEVPINQLTAFHIIDNPLNLQFTDMEASLLPGVWNDPNIMLAIINTNHVLNSGMANPLTDSLIIESVDSPFANGLVVRYEDRNNPVFHTILRYLQSDAVRAFIERSYEGVVPVF